MDWIRLLICVENDCSICFEAYSCMDSICGFGHLLCLYKVLSVVFLFCFIYENLYFWKKLRHTEYLQVCTIFAYKWQVM